MNDRSGMRLLVDAVNASYGGIATYAVNLLRVWPTLFPDDELHVLGTPAVADVLREQQVDGVRPPTLHTAVYGRPAALTRPAVQTLRLQQLVRRLRPDAVLATLPSTSMTALGVPTVVTLYDLRHELRPEQFSRSHRLLRAASYGLGYRIADGYVSISRRSLDDLHRLHPRTKKVRGEVVHLAADHVEDWPGRADGSYAIAFGHHSNKNVDLLLDGWAQLVADPEVPDVPELRLTGVSGPAKPGVEQKLRERGLQDAVTLMPFLADDDFARLFAGAGMIVFPTDFEGFGLPVVEAMWLGKPIVISPDPAVLEVADGHAVVMSTWTPEALARGVRRALAWTADERAAAEAHARQFTWERVVRQTRAALVAAAAEPPRRRALLGGRASR